MVDLDQSFFEFDSGDCHFLSSIKGWQATSLGLLQKVIHSKIERRGVVLKEIFQEPWRERGVRNCRVSDGKDGGVWSGKEEFGRDSEEGGKDVEPGLSQGFGGVE